MSRKASVTKLKRKPLHQDLTSDDDEPLSKVVKKTNDDGAKKRIKKTIEKPKTVRAPKRENSVLTIDDFIPKQKCDLILSCGNGDTGQWYMDLKTTTIIRTLTITPVSNFVGTFIWLIIAVIGIVFHFIDWTFDYKLWMPNELYERTYFHKSIKWMAAIVVGVVEFYGINPQRDDQTDDDVYESQNASKYKRFMRKIAKFVENRIRRATLFDKRNVEVDYEDQKRASVWHRGINMGKYRDRKKPHFEKTWP